jgi:hypothetical protein
MAGQDRAGRGSAGWNFDVYLRTGRLVPRRREIEVKSNPNHDPESGRFTFGAGGMSAARGRQRTHPGQPVPTRPASPQGAAIRNRYPRERRTAQNMLSQERAR